MIRFLIGYLKQQPDWFRMPIPDLEWFLNTPEERIRQIIEDERIPTSYKDEYLNWVIVKNNVSEPYYVYKYQIMQLVRLLGIRSVDHPRDFQDRMDVIRSDRPKFDQSWKLRALDRH